MSRPTLRIATVDDVETLAPLVADFIGGQLALDPFAAPNPDFEAAPWLRARLRASTVITWLAERDGVVIGFCDYSIQSPGAAPRLSYRSAGVFLRSLARSMAHRWRSGRKPTSYLSPRRVGYIHNTYVAPGARGEGVGRALVEACVDGMKKAGADTFYVNTLDANPAGRALFEQLGFRVESSLLRRSGAEPPS